MRETERQINILKAQLPHMRERVIAALTLLLAAIVMMVSSSFAWIVLSVNPEVKGMNTTITSNGNLEIALANGTAIIPPAESAVGDGGKDLVQKNITWGNLINLGDPAYGLENLVLRPASLNQNSLLEKPLYAAGYGTDGRVDTLESDFAYAYWDQGRFNADQVKYGVRAVSSVTYTYEAGHDAALANAVNVAETAVNTAASDLDKLATDNGLQDMAGLMGSYIQSKIDKKLNGSESIVPINPDQIESIYTLMVKLQSNIELSADALAAIFNMEMLRRTEQAYVAEHQFTGTYLLTASQSDIEKKLQEKNKANEQIVQTKMISNLWKLRSDYTLLKSDIAVIGTYRGRDDVVFRNVGDTTYPEIEDYVNHMVDIGTCTVDGVKIGELGSDNIMKLMGGGTKSIVICNGILQRMDKFTGADIQTEKLTVSVKVYSMPYKVTGQATTSAASPYVLPTEKDRALGADTSYKGTSPVAGDTFGMALDFFVRTNATDSHLILQGSPVYEERDEIVSVIIDNESHNLYTVTVGGEQQIAYLDGDTYYAYDREYGVAGEALGTTAEITDATLLKEKVKYIVGYNGVNRVWDNSESAFLDTDSTTQGAGSCYTFYSATPEDQEKSLQLLRHLRVAFIDQNGNLLGEAQLDVDKKVEQTGKVVVPLSLSVTNDSIEGEDGKIYTITPLECNVPTFITALVYLDGMNLTNDQVLAAGEIQGQLNIQFGTTADMDAMDDPLLMESKCHVSATMEGSTSVAFDTATPDQLKKKITVTVDGYEPTKVEAYFLREINSTQGIRQTKMVFQPDASGKWIGEHTFTSPGKYVLREIFLDGVAYELEQPITFTVEGFTISSVYCQDNGKTYMTTNRSFDTSVSLTFASDDVTKMPNSVKGAFIHQETGNRTTVYFTRDVGSTWTGSATFTTSGEYRMEYLELNGQYTGLEENQYVTMDLYLGLTASVYAGDTDFSLDADHPSYNIPVSLVIRSDSGELIGDLGGVWLQYSTSGSYVQENGMGAGMVWNASRQMYQGTFNLNKAGIYNYSYVQINLPDGISTLNEAVTAPTITAIPPDPPAYVSKAGFGEVFALNNSAKFTVRMKHADAATVDAVLKNEAGDVYYARGTMAADGGEQVFTFVLPIIDGTQRGIWTLDGVYLTNIYGSDNVLYNGSTANGPDVEAEDKPLYTVGEKYYDGWLRWNIDDITNDSDKIEPTITVIDSLDLSIDATDKEYTGAFGATHQFDGFNMTVKVHGGQQTSLAHYGMEVVDIKVVYACASAELKAEGGIITNTHGGYTIAEDQWKKVLLNNTTNTTVEFTKTGGSGDTHTLTTTNKAVWIAGEYRMKSVELTISQNGVTSNYSVPSSFYNTAHKYTITSEKPSVSITQIYYPTVSSNESAITINTSGTVVADKTGSGSTGQNANGHGNATASITNGVTAIAPLRCTNGKYWGTWYHGYAPPRVTLTLQNIGVGTGATLNFSSNSNIYTGYSYVDQSRLWRVYSVSGGGTAYSWTAGTTTCQRYIGSGTATVGKATETVSGKGEKTVAGTITATVLNVSYNDATYNFTLDKPITIKQEY